MAKDPAFLFYTGDFSTGTQFFTDEQVGKYIRLMMAQHQHGHLSEKQMIFICKERDDMIFEKFKVDSEGKYYQERLENECNKRKAFSESRRNNRNQLNNDSLHIYFIENPETGLVKIGSSVDVERRFLELRRQYHEGLKLLFVSIKYPQSKETELHNFFAEKKMVNEWYSLSKSDLNDIMTNHIELHMTNHMENEIENENEIKNVKRKPDLIFPFSSKDFLDTWNVLVNEKKWKRKSLSALQASLKQLSEFDEYYAIDLMLKAISGGYQGVVFSNTKSEYLKQKNGTNGKPTDKNGHTIIAGRVTQQAADELLAAAQLYEQRKKDANGNFGPQGNGNDRG